MTMLADRRSGRGFVLSREHFAGTLGVLVRAAQRGLVDLRTAFTRLTATNFRYRLELLDELLVQHEAKKP